MKTYQAVVAAFLAANAVEARLWFGKCPAVAWDTGFNTAAFAGQWYQQEVDAVFAFGGDSSCSTGNYVLNGDGDLDVQWRSKGLFKYGTSPPGVMSCGDSYNCEVSMGSSDSTVPWGILATDYTNWHVAYWCGELFGVQYSWLGIYSKSEQLSDADKAAAKAAVEDKLPGYLMGWPWTKQIKQGGSCQYEW